MTKMRKLLALLCPLALVFFAACGDDDEESEPGGSAAGDLKEYCEVAIDRRTVVPPQVDEEASAAERERATKEFAAELLRLAKRSEGAAPQEIAADIKIIADAVRGAQDADDPVALDAAFENRAVGDAEERTKDFEVENCGWERVEVTMVDYAFQGVPESLDAGPTAFVTKNTGKEPHEFLLFRINDDVDDSFEELLKLSEDEARTKQRFVGATFADPGDSNSVVVDLEPGRYGVSCFIPVGAEPRPPRPSGEEGPPPNGEEGPPPDGEQGPPHWTEGMFAEFIVE